jgi:hypothetical protein
MLVLSSLGKWAQLGLSALFIFNHFEAEAANQNADMQMEPRVSYI